MTNKQFIDYCRSELKQHGFTCRLYKKNDKMKLGHLKVDGFFCFETGKLICSVKNNNIETLIHEFCHFRQFTEDPKLSNRMEINGDWPYNIIASYISNEGLYSFSEFRRACNKSYQLEVDCEKRVIKLIDELGLNINKKKYIKGAVQYLLAYKYLPIVKDWPNKKFRKEVMVQLGADRLQKNFPVNRYIR
jgi:hypothetical protein